MKPKVSVIVPHWPRVPDHDDMLKRCIQSLPEVYEKIIVVNDGTGMGRAINKGFELATGDYLMTLSNDCVWTGGEVEEMCNPDGVVIPAGLPGQWDKPRCFYCMPRSVYDRLCADNDGAFYDTQFEVGFYEDDDMIYRLHLANIPVITARNVRGAHNPGQTLDKLPNRQELMDKNKERYLKKWGRLP